MRRIKLIWDIKGADSYKTAQHHEIHLKEFANRENLNQPIIGLEEENDFHTIAYLVVDESIVFVVRDALKPNRAEIY